LQAASIHDFEADETGTVAIFHPGPMLNPESQITQGRIGQHPWMDETQFGPEGARSIA